MPADGGSNRCDPSRGTGPEVVLNVILLSGSYATYSLLASSCVTTQNVLRPRSPWLETRDDEPATSPSGVDQLLGGQT